MKIIKYLMNDETEKEIRCPSASLEENLAIAKAEAHNGEYTIEDDGVEEITTPTQLDRIESQVAYIAMMTGNSDILEV